ncbi:MAG: hypothetical protein LBR32_09645 [Propionibacteriaceae bacterium]|nr:hypothetical protein [Propionibacteriaceae bacterium]
MLKVLDGKLSAQDVKKTTKATVLAHAIFDDCGGVSEYCAANHRELELAWV